MLHMRLLTVLGAGIGILFMAAAATAQPAADGESAPPQSAASQVRIPAGQDLGAALDAYISQTGVQLIYRDEEVLGLQTQGTDGAATHEAALTELLEGTGLTVTRDPSGAMAIADPSRLPASSAAGQNTVGQRRPGIEEIIVTGQKREERIQDVPIAITAFTQEDLTTQQIAGGPDLITQVPNFAFTKTNFTGYSIQIRGIGTQAISATTDPAVAVALNQTPFVRNRFFEQEFYDMERVEILRGPQGTLFGRNATAGVVNLITAKPEFQEEAMISLDKGNYDSRRWEFMINQPLVDDRMALRIAAAGTKRDGYAVNELTDSPIDGRDLWSSRVSLRFTPNDNLDMNLIWEHFEEEDDRLRSGKQLCKTDEITEVAGYPVSHQQTFPGAFTYEMQAAFSQGCERNSLYAGDSFQTPNGIMIPYYLPARAIGLPVALDDPYVSRTQSRDLRVIESTVDPEYRARSDIGQLQIDYQLTDTLLLESETAYSTDEVYSLQDFNRFNTASGAWETSGTFGQTAIDKGVLTEDGFFCDPQIGCADRLVLVDISTAESSQFSQEFRLSSSFDGPLNFSLGANFLRYDTEDKYYVFINSLTMINALTAGLGSATEVPFYVRGESDNSQCLTEGLLPGDPQGVFGIGGCVYIDPNPIGEVNDLGHNYFLSKNPFNLRSYAVFGETYWNITDALKLTAGLRWSVDDKKAPLHPTWLFVPKSVGYPVDEVIEQKWREPTGRLVLDWKPQLDFTDETLLYGSYSRGYKAGGANPPPFVGSVGRGSSITRPQTFDAEFVNAFELGSKNTLLDGALTVNAAAFYYDYTDYQISEIVDRSAFNQNYDATVWGGEIEASLWARENLRLSFKGGYTKTRIADGERAVDLMNRESDGKFPVITDAVNPNYTGAPGEGRPESEYVYINSLEGNLEALPEDQEFFAFDDWTLYRPFPTIPSSCMIPTFLFDSTVNDGLTDIGNKFGSGEGLCVRSYFQDVDPATQTPYVPNPTASDCDNSTSCRIATFDTYPGWNPATAPNNGEGIAKDLGGNELPNAPNYTATISGDYIVPLAADWALTWHADLHWQSKSWWRIFNDHEYNRLDDYFTMNLAAIIEGGDGWHIMAYVKNVTNETAITGAFLNSDDTGLTTNVFLTEPRLYGLRVTKRWQAGGGGPTEWLGRAGTALLGKEPGEPMPWELTVGGQMLRPKGSGNEIIAPEFISNFDPNADPSQAQGDKLDWGDGREIELTYAPENGWRFSLGARFGESNRSDTGGDRLLYIGDTVEGCSKYAPSCEPGGGLEHPNYNPNIRYNEPVTRTNYGQAEITESEEHLLVDFTVGRDVGLGGLLEASTVSAGLRYAQFESLTSTQMRGVPNWVIPDCWEICVDVSLFPPFYQNDSTRNEYRSDIEARREFKGVGPVLSWEASTRLLGDARGGHVDLDWSVSGGVLFGKQDTSIKGYVEDRYFVQTETEQAQDDGDIDPTEVTLTTVRHERSTEAAVVPTVGAGLGLSYRIDGGSISAGYRWERYFNAIDGGFRERKEYDRTIDGPYLKITFGGGS